MKISLIVPGPEINMYKLGGIRIPNIGVIYLGTILKEAGHDVKIFDENLRRAVDWKGKLRPEVLDADAFGISILTPASLRGYAYAKQIRDAKPDAKIIIGGMHATAMPEEAAQYCDHVVTKEAEAIVTKVFEGEFKEKIITGGPVDINKLPFPDFSLLADHKRVTHFPVSASRGCPYNCPFCQVPSAFERNYRSRSATSMTGELIERKELGQRYLFFNDDLFGLDTNSTAEFMENLISAGICFPELSAETRVNIIKKNPELLRLMKKLGFYNLHVGVESISDDNLKEYNKAQTIEDVQEAMKVANEVGIKINGMFILGMDNDDDCTVDRTVKFIRDMKMDTATFSILYPIPGTPLFDSFNKEGRIMTMDWSLYDGTHVVFKPKRINPVTLQNMWVSAWKKLYSWYTKYGMANRGFFRLFWYPKNREYLKALVENKLSSMESMFKNFRIPTSIRINIMESFVENVINRIPSH